MTDHQPDTSNTNNNNNTKLVHIVPLKNARSKVWAYFGFVANSHGDILDKKKAICKICASTLAYSRNTTNLFAHLKSMHPSIKPAKLVPKSTLSPPNKNGPSTTSHCSAGASMAVCPTQVDEPQDYEPKCMITEQSSVPSTPNSSIRGCTSPDDQDSNYTYASSCYVSDYSAHESDSMSNSLLELEIKTEPFSPSMTLPQDKITNSIVDMLVKDCRPIALVHSDGFRNLIDTLAPGYKVPDDTDLQKLVDERYKELRMEFYSATSTVKTYVDLK